MNLPLAADSVGLLDWSASWRTADGVEFLVAIALLVLLVFVLPRAERRKVFQPAALLTLSGLCALLARGLHDTEFERPLHLGRSTQVWQIEMRDDSGRLSCVSRLTMAVLAPGASPAA